jgi:hypothetical protein
VRIGFASGGSYTSRSSAIADEEAINWFRETTESQGSITPSKSYGGQTAGAVGGLYGTPGLSLFAALPGVPRGEFNADGRLFVVAGTELVELAADGTQTNRGTVASDGNPASLAFNSIQLLIVSGGHAYCFTLATNALLEVTTQLAGVPIQCDESDTLFTVCFQNSNKFQISQVLDGTTWPGQLVNEVSVFPDNITGIIFNHRELWVFGNKRCQPYQNTGSANIFDVIPGALIEMGAAATFSVARLDNSIFWVGQDERGALVVWRSNGYTPTRISTHAVETDLASYSTSQVAGMTSYSYQDGGHFFYVLYVPGSQWSWTYDVSESLWHKRAFWTGNAYQAHHSWNHVYAFGKHLVGDWSSNNLYVLSMNNLTDNGSLIRRVRRSPTISDEMQWITHAELVIDFAAGLGSQPPLLDGNNAPRPPQAMLRWSDDRGFTWSNEHVASVGFAGQFKTRTIFRRLGRSRYRIYELVVTDPEVWVVVDAYLRTA